MEKVIELYQKKCEGPIKTGIRRGLISGIVFMLEPDLLQQARQHSLMSSGFSCSHDDSCWSVSVGSLAPNLGKVKSSAASIFAILDRKSKIDSSDESGTTIENVKGEIEHVSFKYPTRPDVPVFQDLCLTIHHGKTVLWLEKVEVGNRQSSHCCRDFMTLIRVTLH
ncbi:P-glycoprotein 13 [Prunus dulcis]|uniref:p-glycoprotein 13 n=1 Tax=Prunus dulcis TaxID=3755 RepID=A0A4Y1QM97_PRUDU|nr:P-glycoprotein 13 [Prunus dulcis]